LSLRGRPRLRQRRRRRKRKLGLLKATDVARAEAQVIADRSGIEIATRTAVDREIEDDAATVDRVHGPETDTGRGIVAGTGTTLAIVAAAGTATGAVAAMTLVPATGTAAAAVEIRSMTIGATIAAAAEMAAAAAAGGETASPPPLRRQLLASPLL